MILYVLLKDDNKTVESYALPQYKQVDPWKVAEVPDYFSTADLKNWHYDGGRLVPNNSQSDISVISSKVDSLSQMSSMNQFSMANETKSLQQQISAIAFSTMKNNNSNNSSTAQNLFNQLDPNSSK